VKVTWLPDVERRERHVAIGEFDGVHLGHREVIGDADTVLTFEPHPRSVVTPDAAPKLITPLPVKVDVVAGLGVRELVVIPFDRDFASLSAERFIEEVLVGRLGAVKVSVGENFRFGHRAQGDVELLRAQEAFETRVAQMVEVDGEIVSSTHIRGLIVAGDVEAANRFLGLPYHLRGIVEGGDQRGRTLGVRPTFVTGRGVLIEAYLIGFEGDLYGRELRLAFLRRLRGEKRFDSVDELVAQMHADVDEARRAAA